MTALGSYALFRTARARHASKRLGGARDLDGQKGSRPRVVILGGGFAGLSAACTLARRARDRAEILVIDRQNYSLFTPMIYQVATCGVDPFDVAVPIRQVAHHHGFEFRQATVNGIDLDARRVLLDDGEASYDYLIIALGSVASYYGIPGAEANSIPLTGLEEAVAIRHRILDSLERATRASSEEAEALLTFVVVGGGPNGVEAAAALADLLHRVEPSYFPNSRSSRTRVVLVESIDRLLAHFSNRLGGLAQQRLAERQVEVWLGATVKEVGDGVLTTGDGRTVRTGTVIWAAGVHVAELTASLAAPHHNRGGGLVVAESLEVVDRPGVYAIGDSGYIVDARSGHAAPLLAEAAVQEGPVAAENVARAIEGRGPKPFHYRSLGNAISFGRKDGAIEVGRIVVDGVIGGLGWRLLHLAKMVSLSDQLGSIADWTVDFLGEQNTSRLDLELPPARQAVRVEPASAESPVARAA